MNKKLFNGIMIGIIILVILPLIWYYLQTNKPPQPRGDDLTDKVPPREKRVAEIPGFNVFENEKFGYSVEYPEDWSIGTYGESAEKSRVVFFVSDEGDLKPAEGGLPLGAKAEIIVQDLKELREMDKSMADIDTIEEYVGWQNTYQAGFDTEMEGKCMETDEEVNGMDAIKKVCENPLNENVGKSRKVQILSPDTNYVYLIQYLGREPYYSENTAIFEKIYKSFEF